MAIDRADIEVRGWCRSRGSERRATAARQKRLQSDIDRRGMSFREAPEGPVQG
jgi:hypothetical protein